MFAEEQLLGLSSLLPQHTDEPERSQSSEPATHPPNSSLSDLPRFLTPLGGGRSGFAPVQKTVAALTAEIQHAAQPMPAWVLPVADGVEDVAAMSLPTVEKTREIVERLRLLAGIELMIAAQACDLRGGIILGTGTAGILAAVRERVAPLTDDRATAPDIAALDALVAEGRFASLAEPAPT